LSLIVVQGDRVLTEDAVGFADIARHRPVTLDTVYLWFSMTKSTEGTSTAPNSCPPKVSSRCRRSPHEDESSTSDWGGSDATQTERATRTTSSTSEVEAASST
jgi:hypothetical protein